MQVRKPGEEWNTLWGFANEDRSKVIDTYGLLLREKYTTNQAREIRNEAASQELIRFVKCRVVS